MMENEKNVRRYLRNSSAVFLYTTDEFGPLHNMAAGYELVVNGVMIRTSEALYQTCRFPSYPLIQQEIINQKSPISAKMKAERAGYFYLIRSDFRQIKVDLMRWVLRVKLVQHWESFGDILERTGDMPIVEESSKNDSYWGAIARSDDNGILVGINAIGRLLMELRQEKRKKGDAMKILSPPNIKNFLLLEKEIGIIT